MTRTQIWKPIRVDLHTRFVLYLSYTVPQSVAKKYYIQTKRHINQLGSWAEAKMHLLEEFEPDTTRSLDLRIVI